MDSKHTPRVAFSNRTNEICAQSTPLDGPTLKRRVCVDGGRNKKRVKVEKTPNDDVYSVAFRDNSMDAQLSEARQRKCTFSNIRSKRMQPRCAPRNTCFSTRPILTTFVLSKKSDVYNLHSEDPHAPGIPFACAFSADAKKGGVPILAVAMQDGMVELLNVSKRQDWDFEPQRISIHTHTNAILDVKWGSSDQTIATASSDSTTRITSVLTKHTLATLAHHKGSVKTLDWDPNHADILSTAGRDGSICVWDLRIASHSSVDNASTLASSPPPVMTIPYAHYDNKPRGNVSRSPTRTVTSLLYLPQDSRHLISSSSFDGILRQWDLRYPVMGKAKKPALLLESMIDPTLQSGSRSRGISSLALGRNHSAGILWGLAADSSVYAYPMPISAPFAHSAPQNKLAHPGLYLNSFHVKLAMSPCGSWLASGSSGGGVYLWDVAAQLSGPRRAVELKATKEETSAVDWAKDFLAACCDDGTVRIWRPNLEVSSDCRMDPNEKMWDWAWAND